MILVISAKRNRDFVPKQIAAFQKWVKPFADRVIVYSNEPIEPMPNGILTRRISNRVGVGKWMFQQGAIRLLHTEFGAQNDMMFVHNDIFPLHEMEFSKLECSRGFSYQYLFVPKGSFLPNLKKEIWDVAETTTERDLPQNVFYDLFPNIEFNDLKYFERGFIHFDGIDLINKEEVGGKHELMDRLYNTPLAKDIISMALRYKRERDVWVEAGKPLRSPEQIKEIFNICKGCPFFDESEAGVGNCGICGCFIKEKGNLLNKAAWATTQCPHNPPKWGG